MRLENTWQEIRDHSFIQNHSRSSDSQFLLFSSLTHLLQGSGQRTPDMRSETITSSRITPDLHIHIFFSSVHLTHLLQGSGQRTPDTRSETIPSSRITPDPPDSQLLLFSSPHTSSTGFRSENTWHEIRDHSFIQNHSRSSYSHLLLFSSPHSSSTGFRSENTWHEIRDQFLHPESLQTLQIHSFFSSVHLTHLLQGSGQRTPDKRSETIPSSRITPDPSDSQLLLFSSPHSSSTGFRSENTWHEIRDHSFIQNLSRSSDSQLLLFSSPHSSSTGFRSENTWHEIRDHSFIQNHSRPFRFTASSLQFTSLIFYRVQVREHLTRDQSPFLHPESLQIFRFTASSLQFTSLIFYRVQVREHLTRDQSPFLHPESLQILQIHSFFSSIHLTHLLQGSGQRTGMASRSLVLCSVTHSCVDFEVCVWIILRLQDPNMAHYTISNRVSHLLIFFICWYLIVRRRFSATLKKIN